MQPLPDRTDVRLAPFPDCVVAVRVPAHGLTGLHLRPDPLTHVARTNRLYHGDHVSVWAPKRRLLSAVVGYS